MKNPRALSPRSGPKTPTEALVTNLRVAGIQAEVIPITNTSGFAEAIILPKKEIPTEKMMRVYRGVNQLDESVLSQLPYAMRAEDEYGFGSVILEDVRPEVTALANEPTYQNLLAYVNKVRPHLSDREVQRLEEDLAQIEDGVLKGYRVRTELIYKQIEHNGGTADSGIAPYISASWSSQEALGYIRSKGALVVIDVPISQIEDLGKDGTETNIKGALDPKYITAIVPVDKLALRDFQSHEAVNTALQAVTEAAHVPVYGPAETQTVRAQQSTATSEKEEQQWQVDVQAVRQKRTSVLMTSFAELGLDAQAVQQTAAISGTDIYTHTRTTIFDAYADRLSRLDRGGNVTDYEYIPGGNYGPREKFDRANITDEMLYQLRNIVRRREQRELERTGNLSEVNNAPIEPINSTQQRFLATRGGQLVEVTADQLTPEEQSVFEETAEDPKFDRSSLEDPEGFLNFLKQKNPYYSYADDLTPDMVKRAVEWAQLKGFSPSELSPAQIQLAQEYVPGTKTQAEIAEEVIEERTIRLKTNKEELLAVLAPTSTEYFHATPGFENVQSILENGLYCDSNLGLGGSAASLDRVPPNADQAVKDQIVEANAIKLADPHRGYRYEVIIELPPLTLEQQADYQARRARNENVSYTSYYVQKLAEQVGTQGVGIAYDAILPSQYIKGFIDLDTGQFIPRQQIATQ